MLNEVFCLWIPDLQIIPSLLGTDTFIAKLSQAPANLDWDSFIITIPVFRPRPSPGIVSKQASRLPRKLKFGMGPLFNPKGQLAK